MQLTPRRASSTTSLVRPVPPLRAAITSLGRVSFSPPSLLTQLWEETPAAASLEGKSGPLCWHCGEPGHFRDQCTSMDVDTLIQVPEVMLSTPDRAGKYYIPVRVRGNTYQALLDSGCNQTSIHQRLMQPGTLNTSCMVKARCVHGGIRRYPIALVTIQLGDQNHRVEAAVNPHLSHPVILETNWPLFSMLLRDICKGGSCRNQADRDVRIAGSGEATPGPAGTVSGGGGLMEREAVAFPPLGYFPLEQSRDETLRHALGRVQSIDGNLEEPDRIISVI